MNLPLPRKGYSGNQAVLFVLFKTFRFYLKPNIRVSFVVYLNRKFINENPYTSTVVCTYMCLLFVYWEPLKGYFGKQ